jgi:hypothetical protein
MDKHMRSLARLTLLGRAGRGAARRGEAMGMGARRARECSTKFQAKAS